MQLSLICKCLFKEDESFVTILQNLNQIETNLGRLFPCDY